MSIYHKRLSKIYRLDEIGRYRREFFSDFMKNRALLEYKQ